MGGYRKYTLRIIISKTLIFNEVHKKKVERSLIVPDNFRKDLLYIILFHLEFVMFVGMEC